MTVFSDYWHVLLLIWAGNLMGLVSPGPSFLAIVNVAMADRKRALWTALGCACGTASWASLTSAGLSTLLVIYPSLAKLIQFLGAVYLGWLGIQSLRKAIRDSHSTYQTKAIGGLTLSKISLPQSPSLGAYLSGLAIHLTNPKAAMVWLALTSFSIRPDTHVPVILLMIAGSFCLSLSWHGLLALAFSTQFMQGLFKRLEKTISWIFGLFFIGLAVKLIYGLWP